MSNSVVGPRLLYPTCITTHTLASAAAIKIRKVTFLTFISAISPLSDLIELLWITDDNLNAQLHLGLLQAEVQTGYLGVGHALHHS